VTLFAIGLVSPPAAACSCFSGGVQNFSPAFVHIPTNAVIRTIGDGDAPHPREIYEDGVLRTDVVNDLAQHGRTFVLTQIVQEPFRLGATVEVRVPEDEPLVLEGTSFTLQVLAEADHTPPDWEGLYTVDQSRTILPFTSCGRFRGHTFEWEGMTDDLWDASELLVIAVPHDPTHAEFVSDGITETIGDGACSDDDPSLKGDFHRAYDLFVEDGSGNRIGPFEVDTRHCGCAGLPSPAGGVALVFGAALLARRRRSA
jgi:hypothetical protein